MPSVTSLSSQQYYASGPTEGEASKLIVEWTNQHGCGGNKDSPHKTNCNIVIQVTVLFISLVQFLIT